MEPTKSNDPSGKSWTRIEEIANAIDRSHACNGGMVVLVCTDGDDYEVFKTEFSGIAATEKRISYGVWEFTHPGDTTPGEESPAWAIQLTMVE